MCMDMNNFEKFKFIMSSNDYDINRVCVFWVGEMYEKRLEIINSKQSHL